MTVCSVAVSVRLSKGTCCLSSGHRSNERIEGTVLMSIDPFTAVCHVAICNTVNRSLPPALIVTVFLGYVVICWNSQLITANTNTVKLWDTVVSYLAKYPLLLLVCNAILLQANIRVYTLSPYNAINPTLCAEIKPRTLFTFLLFNSINTKL